MTQWPRQELVYPPTICFGRHGTHETSLLTRSLMLLLLRMLMLTLHQLLLLPLRRLSPPSTAGSVGSQLAVRIVIAPATAGLFPGKTLNRW